MARELPCSNCGAPLNWSPGALSLTCPHCGTENELPPGDPGPWGGPRIEEQDYEAALRDATADALIEESQTIGCPGCGAEIEFGPDTLADQCPFCATPLARSDLHIHRHPRPQGVLPFALTEREARGRMKTWLGSRWFAPNGLKTFAEAGRPMAGVYIPHYTYDAQGDARYQGFRGDAYYVNQTVTVMVDGKPQRRRQKVRKIRWTPTSGRVQRFFDDVLVPASDTLGDLASAAEEAGGGWDLQALEPYSEHFLAGFRAEAPETPLDQGFARACTVMEAGLTRDARFQIGGDAQRITRLSARYDRVTFKHVLLPVWLAAYRYGNKPFRVIINGRTGQISGERPYSWWKIAGAVLAALIVVAIIAVIASQR